MLTTLILTVLSLPALESPLPPASRTPMLVLDHAGPNATVTALAFAPEASILYVGGYDKLVRRYRLRNGKYEPIDPLRVPLGPGNAGAVNAIAVSPDGKWVAVAGRAPIRGEVWAGSADGIVTSTRYLPPLLKRDLGVVYLFDATNPAGGKVLRGAQGEVRGLAFANPAPAGGPALVTASIESNPEGKEVGAVRVFDVGTAKELDSLLNFPATAVPPGLAAWASEPDGKTLRVAVAWEKPDSREVGGELVIWDAPGGKPQRLADAAFNSPLAVRVAKNSAGEVITGAFNLAKRTGQLTVRTTRAVIQQRTLPLTAPRDQFLIPLGIAAFPVRGRGDATAVLAEVVPRPKGLADRPTELRLLDVNGRTLGRVSLEGVSNQTLPLLAASSDGRYIAVGGFTNHRVEVFDTLAVAANRVTPQKLPGAPGEFAGVHFLAGHKLWLGSTQDTVARGGIVLDLAARVASANDGQSAMDEPPVRITPALVQPDADQRLAGRVTFPPGSTIRDITLPAGERPTAAAVHPGKPTWNPALGPIVAVAHTRDDVARTLITLHDASGQAILELGGPALPVQALAFSATRPLLAAVGQDRTVFIWSLRDLGRKLPAIGGMTVTARGAEVVVASIEPTSSARGKLAAGDVIEAVGGGRGGLQPVKTPLDFVLAVRALPVGGEARVQVAGKAAPVVVRVGTALGHRRALINLWVDPVANRDGKHDWIGWTRSGPYDANSVAAEAKIVWVTATGDSTRPTTIAPANQYRHLYYKKDFLRFLTDAADVAVASERYVRAYPPRKPELVATLTGLTTPVERLPGGELLTRTQPDGIEITLRDPSELLVLDRAVLGWRTIARDGTPGAWREMPYSGGQMVIPVASASWARGEHRFEFALRTSPNLPPLQLATSWRYLPAPPPLAVSIDGKAPQSGQEVTVKNDAVAVAALVPWTVDPVNVTLTTSAPGGDRPQSLTARPWGLFEPVRVKLHPPPLKTVIWVTATPRAEGVDVVGESRTIAVTVRQLPPDPVPPPRISLVLTTPHDPPSAPGNPRVAHDRQVALTATVDIARAVADFEWNLADGRGWVPGKLDEKGSEDHPLTLPANGEPLAVKVRARVKNSPFAEDSVAVVFAALPHVEINAPPSTAKSPRLALSGSVENPGSVPFKLHAVVTSRRTGKSETFPATVDVATKSWGAAVRLAPGENDIALVVRNRWGELRKSGVARIAHLRPPVLVSVPALDVGTGLVGDVVATVATPRGVPPTQFHVDDRSVGFLARGEPVIVFGLAFQTLRAPAVSVKNAEGKRVASLRVIARNAEGDSRPVTVPVRGMDPKPPPPPTIGLWHDSSATISHGDELISDDEEFALTLQVLSEAPLTKAEVWHGGAAGTDMALVEGIDHRKAVAVGGRHRLEVQRALRLRRGVNRVRVVAANRGELARPVDFSVNYLPPAVRVVIDSVAEPGPGGKLLPLGLSAGNSITATGPVLQVRGRVVWDANDDPVARDRTLSVVLFANQVAHLPVRPDLQVGEKQERAFVVPAFLNASTTRLRVELRSGTRAGVVAQQGTKPAELQVACARPLDRQRLHLVIIAPGVPRRERAGMVRSIVEAVGGVVPENRPDFDHGEFEQPSFTRAILHRTLVQDVNTSDLNTVLIAVDREIRKLTERPGQQWMNDVVLVYYQGRDVVGKDDRLLLHTTGSLMYRDSPGVVDRMIPVDDLLSLPGFPCAMVNVADPAGQVVRGDPLTSSIALLRYPWKNAADLRRLPGLFATAMTRKAKFGEITVLVRNEKEKIAAGSGEPTVRLPDTERERIIGLVQKP